MTAVSRFVTVNNAARQGAHLSLRSSSESFVWYAQPINMNNATATKPIHDQRYFAKPSNKPYSPQVPPATLALLVSLQGAPWRTASDFRRQLVRAGHAPVPPVDACVEIKFYGAFVLNRRSTRITG